jgi:hypothetical protein
MKNRTFDLILQDYSTISHKDDPELSLLEAALFIEECLDVTLCDAEITKSNFGNLEAIRRFVAARTGQ